MRGCSDVDAPRCSFCANNDMQKLTEMAPGSWKCAGDVCLHLAPTHIYWAATPAHAHSNLTPPIETLIHNGVPFMGFSMPHYDIGGNVTHYVAEGDWKEHPRQGFWCAGEVSLAHAFRNLRRVRALKPAFLQLKEPRLQHH